MIAQVGYLCTGIIRHIPKLAVNKIENDRVNLIGEVFQSLVFMATIEDKTATYVTDSHIGKWIYHIWVSGILNILLDESEIVSYYKTIQYLLDEKQHPLAFFDYYREKYVYADSLDKDQAIPFFLDSAVFYRRYGMDPIYAEDDDVYNAINDKWEKIKDSVYKAVDDSYNEEKKTRLSRSSLKMRLQRVPYRNFFKPVCVLFNRLPKKSSCIYTNNPLEVCEKNKDTTVVIQFTYRLPITNVNHKNNFSEEPIAKRHLKTLEQFGGRHKTIIPIVPSLGNISPMYFNVLKNMKCKNIKKVLHLIENLQIPIFIYEWD
jgi:hypothetical protein